jgi:hypothetical protein
LPSISSEERDTTTKVAKKRRIEPKLLYRRMSLLGAPDASKDLLRFAGCD